MFNFPPQEEEFFKLKLLFIAIILKKFVLIFIYILKISVKCLNYVLTFLNLCKL